MGGRGGAGGRAGSSNSKKIVSFDVDFGGSTVHYEIRGGFVYGDSGVKSSLPVEKIISNAKNLGYTVTTYNQSQNEERERRLKEDREKTDAFLNKQYVSIGGNRRDQRYELIYNRAMKRKRR